MIPYDLILVAAAIVLSIRHIGSASASNRSKQLIVGLLTLSLVLPRLSFAPGAAALLLQGGVCAYLIFREIYASVPSETNDQR